MDEKDDRNPENKDYRKTKAYWGLDEDEDNPKENRKDNVYSFNKPRKPGDPNPWEAAEREADDYVGITPFRLKDHRQIKPRDWLYGRHYIRGFLGLTIASSGVGKSSLVLVETLAMATGRDLLGVKPRKRLKTWLCNAEDPLDEIERRVAAACLHFTISAAELEGYLFIDSGRDSKWKLARATPDGVMIDETVVRNMLDRIIERKIDVLSLDPYAAIHEAPENDNTMISAIATALGSIADKGKCAIMVVHHTRKTPPGQELSTEDARGASALLAAARTGRALNRMPPEVAAKLGIINPRAFLRISSATEKASMTEGRVDDDWYQLVSVDLQNGIAEPSDGGAPIPADQVGVIVRWVPPDLLAGVDAEAARRAQALIGSELFRADVRAVNWIGIPVAQALGIDVGVGIDGKLKPGGEFKPEDKIVVIAARERVKAIVEKWLDEGWLKKVRHKDTDHKFREYITTGAPATSIADTLNAARDAAAEADDAADVSQSDKSDELDDADDL